MDTTKRTKRERQRAAAEARQRTRRRQEQRRTLGYVLGGLALIAVVVVGVVTLMGGGGGGAGPSGSGQISVEGPARAEPLGPGEAMPGFSAPGIGGGAVSWSDVGDRPAVLSVWAPWCPHCQVELPVLDRVMRDFEGVTFVTVVTSIGDAPGPDPAEFLADNGIDAPTAIDDDGGTLASALGIQGFPTIYFVGSDGRVVQEVEGEVDEQTLRQIVGSLT
ncbi:MAG TPA: TlpA disulfide reductase family protein [Actinomycetota bacterium]|nr:TlpA disulfide reductase family protein [Actinomycetota bacterium]